MEFKSTDALFSRIKEDFSTYSNSGLLDDGRFYHYIKYILNYLGVYWFIEEQDFLDVQNYKVELPSNFQQLNFAYKCIKDINDYSGDGVVLKEETYDHYPLLNPDWHASVCASTCCNPPETAIFNSYTNILVPRGDFLCTYSSPELLVLGNVNTKRQCSDTCPNVYSISKNKITIQNNTIYTNFCDGSIYISYYVFPLDEQTNLPMIPDNVRIEKCIEDYIKYNLVKNIVINKEADIARLLTFYKQEYEGSLQDAVYETKLPTFSNMMKQARRNRRKFDLFF